MIGSSSAIRHYKYVLGSHRRLPVPSAHVHDPPLLSLSPLLLSSPRSRVSIRGARREKQKTMMCTVAPFAIPEAGCFIGAAVAPPPQRTTMMATYAVEQQMAPPSTSPCVYDDGVEMDTLLGNIHDLLVHQQPTTPLASIMKKKKKKMDPSWTYDADIEATFRKMEKDPAERPSEEDYLSTTQQEGTIKMMTMVDRADLVAWMYACSRIHRLLPPGTLHRAVNYVDRYLSVKKIGTRRQDLILLGAVAVFVAAKYEESSIKWVFNADDVACDVGAGCTREQVLAAERDLVATLGYRLSGPTAYTFVDHFTRHDDDDTHEGVAVMRALAHHIADITLLDYRCVSFLPSAVAASAILLARRIIINSEDDSEEEELLKMTRYKLQDLTDIIDDIMTCTSSKTSGPDVR
ncbi:hypothetical protein QOZ80_2BG0188410 [Eleusine coracana subsp. coracana]|nr:hypothetical protein QOZ80_2BG0188410 [Eleusine coracana subsp. coracana]